MGRGLLRRLRISKAGVFGCHECLEFVLFCLRDGGLHLVVVIVLEEHWKHLLRGVAFRTTEGVGAGKDVLCDKLVEKMVTLAIATQYSSRLPEADVVQELVAGDSYFANEQLVEVVGG